MSIEHATEIASLIGNSWGADKYEQAFSKPLGAQFVYLCMFCIYFSDLNYKIVIFLSQTESTPKHFF